MDAGKLGRILGGLTLSVVKVSRNRDDRTVQVIVERVLCPKAQSGENLGTHLDRRLVAIHRRHADHALRRLIAVSYEVVRQFFGMRDILQTAPHETLDGRNGVARIPRLGGNSVIANLASAIFKVADHRRQEHPALAVRQAFRHAVANSRNQGVGGAQIDTHRNAPLVRIGGLAGFGNLQKRHEIQNLNVVEFALLGDWTPKEKTKLLGLIVPAALGDARCRRQIAQRT